jgi:hypothetical protein
MPHGEAGDSGTIRFPEMEPVSRPEWASPLTVGKHAREFLSALPEQATKEVLQALSKDPKMLAFLGRRPLARLEFSGRLPDRRWNGSYHASLGVLTVNAFRGRAMPISVRAREAAPQEYFSESFAAYRFEDSFADIPRGVIWLRRS